MKSTTTTTSGGPKDVIPFAWGWLRAIEARHRLVQGERELHTTITAAVKQSNNFNDSSGSANLSPSGQLPDAARRPCFTVSGRVFQDRNLDNAYTTAQARS